MIIKKYLKPIETKTERLEIKITGIEKGVFEILTILKSRSK